MFRECFNECTFQWKTAFCINKINENITVIVAIVVVANTINTVCTLTTEKIDKLRFISDQSTKTFKYQRSAIRMMITT